MDFRGPGARTELMLVCSTGGHLLQLHQLRDAWAGRTTMWVTFDKSDARSLLAQERVVYAYGPTNRSILNLVRNLGLAWKVVRRARPKLVITTGAGVAVPFAWIARLHGARIAYVESISRIDRPSLTWRLIAPVADQLYAQWPELAERMPRARYVGSVFTPR